jgi:hypothetical protein
VTISDESLNEEFVAHVGRIGDALEEVEHQLELLKRTLDDLPNRIQSPIPVEVTNRVRTDAS